MTQCLLCIQKALGLTASIAEKKLNTIICASVLKGKCALPFGCSSCCLRRKAIPFHRREEEIQHVFKAEQRVPNNLPELIGCPEWKSMLEKDFLKGSLLHFLYLAQWPGTLRSLPISARTR